ncbi:hypothetical protein NGRA_1142 [Nosema granulosis]|uniref:Uncharacterized protein n=1 Tax=Nosema granulosis TaxID=83296 RepID=A0A9P6GZI1_9MICR|nr:hypothetical protein NGRA_1142 [Nosema granulosis]
MSIYLEKIKKILGTFEPEEQAELKNYYVEKSTSLMMDDKKIGKAKIHLLRDMEEVIEDEEVLSKIQRNVIDHKVLQTRALVLDLISTDYTKDLKGIYKPESWVKEIVKDIKETFLKDDLFETPSPPAPTSNNNNKIPTDNPNIKEKITQKHPTNLIELYNKKLVEEFKDIFLSEVVTFGSAGNQLVLDLRYYANFITKFVSFDFEDLISSIKKQIEPTKLMKDKEIEEILQSK